MSVSPSVRSDPLLTGRPKYPYPGLRPFEAEEWSIFFGRERMIDDAIERLGTHQLIFIHGSSGAGKSSLVRAGVLPKLARQHLRAGAPWRTCSMRPSGGPMWNLAKELARLEGSTDDAEHVGWIVGQFNRRGATLSSVAGSLKNLEGQRLCILVDQLEELFRFEKETSREEAELFVDLLVRSNVEATGNGHLTVKENLEGTAVHVVVTMRSEYLGECARFYGLAEAINRTQYLMPRMDRDGLVRAIRRPAQLYGGEVSIDLTERLMAEAAGREDELPLIQHGLMLMWHEAVTQTQPGNKIVLGEAPLEKAGGLARLLSAHADAIVEMAAPDPECRYGVERLFRALTDLNVEGQAIRRPQVFRDLVALTQVGEDKLRPIIDALRRDGVSFLTPYSPQPISDATTIDITHEALIRCWDRLADPQDGWLKREFDDGLIWRSLLVEAKSFESNKQRVLSPATTDERWDWWRRRKLTATWAARYGGNFGLVERLLLASRRKARHQRQLHYAFVGLLLFTSGAGLAYASWTNRLRMQMWADLYVRRTVLSLAEERALKPGAHFQECTRCPEMVVVPAGSFTMGSPETEEGRDDNEGPQHLVTIAAPFAVSRLAVTFDQWDGCYQLGGCSSRLDDSGWGRGDRPVIKLSWSNAQEYVRWLSKETGKDYHLLSEAEWEYAARARANTTYYWGDDIGIGNANCSQCGSEWDGKETAPVGSFKPNGFDLYDMAGNVWQWVQDCSHDDYTGAPIDGSAWMTGDCSDHIIRGGSWFDPPDTIRAAVRRPSPSVSSWPTLGLRVGETLAP